MDSTCSDPSDEEELEVASQVAKMEVVDTEVMRVTYAHKAFGNFGRALRPKSRGDFYKESFVAEKISSFWSHSWHGNYRMKLLTILMRYNGPASVMMGSLVACLMSVLFSLGLLPGFVRIQDDYHGMEWSSWSLGAGFIATVITFLAWRSKFTVFLDRVCIHHDDQVLKRASIMSLAGILKCSEEMLVLWDPTWSERLWCQFELGAFLKSKQESEQVLVIRPIFVGSCSAAVFIGMFLIILPVTIAPFNVEFAYIPVSGAIIFAHFSGMFIIVTFRAYFRGIETMKEHMSSFSIDRSKSFCCDSGHVEAGNRFMCDRGVVKRCVSVWFGSEEAFEDCIRSEVVEKVVTRLQHQVFTRKWSLSVTVPLFWGFCDLSASWFAFSKVDHHSYIPFEAVATLLEGFVIWFLCCPIFVDYTLLVTRRYCRKAASTAGEILKNVAVLLLLLVGLSVIAGTFLLSNEFRLPPMPRAGVFAGFWCLMALFHLVLKCI